jgi:NADPH:quinone reductase-like Zn-dependent oxidoreductase
MSAETTEAVAFERYGGPEVLGMASIPVQPAGLGEVRVRTWATPVNPADVWLRQGGIEHLMSDARWPVVPGLELAGEIESVGPGVQDLQAGQAVVAITTFVGTGRGAQAALATVKAEDVALIPPGVDPLGASTLPMSALTALATLDRLGLEAGATLGVIGAAGAVGGYVVQLARERDLRVLALASASDEELVRSFGADTVIVSRSPAAFEQHQPGGVDGLVDTAVLGAAALSAVRPGGTLALMRPLSEPDLERAAALGVRTELISVRTYQGDRRRLQGLLDRVSDGRLVLRVAQSLPPADAATAHRRMEAGGVRGRIVLDWRPPA